jgi:hydroxymethylglutaryl-CoA reductase (NADPH)
MKQSYVQAVGKGLINQTGFDLRLNDPNTCAAYIEPQLKSKAIEVAQWQNNIEGYSGATEIPRGFIEPFLYNDEDSEPQGLHIALDIREEALAASMNRRVKAISQWGASNVQLEHKEILGATTISLAFLNQSLVFENLIEKYCDQIKRFTAEHSDHSDLIEIKPGVFGKVVHHKFIYQASDPAGQNRTTYSTCMAYTGIQEAFQEETYNEIESFVIDGNGSSDKKVCYYSMQNGGGASVFSECFKMDDVYEKALRTVADDLSKSFKNSMKFSRRDGMIRYHMVGDDFLIIRVCFCRAASTLVNYPFNERVFTYFTMLNALKTIPVE